MLTVIEFDRLTDSELPGARRSIRSALAALERLDHADLMSLTAAALDSDLARVYGGDPEKNAKVAIDCAFAALAELKKREQQNGK